MEMFRSIFAESSTDSEADDDVGEHHTLTTSSSSAIADTSSVLQHKQQTVDATPFQANPAVGRKWQNFASFSTPLPVHPPILPPPILPPPVVSPPPPPPATSHPVFHEGRKASAVSAPMPPEEVSE